VVTTATLFLYLGLSIAFFNRDVSWSKYYFGSSTDPVQFAWFLNWWPFAISHGLNPFICKYVWAPSGYNFAWATAVPFLAILAWPVTVLGNPVLAYNILTLSAPALAAWTAFLLCRELTDDWAASLIGGFLFGFSTPEYWELLSELNLDMVFLIPLAVLLGVRRVRGSLGRWPFIIQLSLVLVAQLGISTEVLATLCILSALIWLIFLLFAPVDAKRRFLLLAADIGICAPIVMGLASPFLYYLVKGAPDFPSLDYPAFLASAEPLQFVLSGIPIRSVWAALAGIARQFTGFTPDQGTFIGIPLLIIVILYFRRRFRNPYASALLVSIGFTGLASLGPILHFNGQFTSVVLPWKLFTQIPVIRAILPARMLTYVTLETAIVAALWLAAEKRPAMRVPCFILAGLACLILVPWDVDVLPAQWVMQPAFATGTHFTWTRWPVQPFFTPAHVRQVLGPMPNVILLPNTESGPGMAWQLEAKLNFTQAEGYVGFRPLREQKSGVLDEIYAGPPKPDFGTVFPAFCAAHRVGYILIGPGTPVSVVDAIAGLGWPHHMDVGIEVVKIPEIQIRP